MKRHVLAVAVAVLVLSGLARAEGDKKEGGDGLAGFSGQVRGVVEAKNDDGTIDFKVARIVKLWKGNEAKNAESLVGQTIKVAAGGGDNKERNALHVRYLATLNKGDEVTLELTNKGGDGGWRVLELNKEQREAAGAGNDKGKGEGDGEKKASGRNEGGDDANEGGEKRGRKKKESADQ
ncbi:MAG: hypothetical protein L6R28_17820 [Planctomycetes bacterium]|nr:hypothetical protein [Planctomycetota bacterium]